ncbi:hypothetical protein [Candidatus Nitrosocosmicus hydrocola]|uniref:hypothetical protein n=1 Tax=Candidatus Nitrosocosmicus hydrocola TaxID=1826872 RepID=UPI0011E5C016|nr:hypothetical protein [Candidatus Nitrosocosmicus hydrocola]
MISNKPDNEKIRYLILSTILATSLAIILDFGPVSSPVIVLAQSDNLSDSSSLTNLPKLDSVIGNVSNFEQTLGQPFYVENTKSTYMRVLNVDNLPSVEVSYNGNSTINGSPTQTIGTIVDKMGAEGSVHSNGQAIILTATGQVITYKSQSIGYYNPDGSFSDSGIILFSLPFYGSTNTNINNVTNSQSGMGENDYSDFNNILGIYKKTVDPLGNGLTKVWKWG